MKKVFTVLFLLAAFFTKGQGPSALPVTLTEFKAEFSGHENYMVISWTCLQAINIHSFTIEKSTNSINWSPVASVMAKAASNTAENYSCADNAPKGMNYYRLRVIDNSNNSSYSGIIVKKVKSLGGNVSVYPNPAVNTVNIATDVDLGAKSMSVQLINQSGQEVAARQTNSFSNIISLSLAGYKAGLYALNIRLANGKTETRQLVVAK